MKEVDTRAAHPCIHPFLGAVVGSIMSMRSLLHGLHGALSTWSGFMVIVFMRNQCEQFCLVSLGERVDSEFYVWDFLTLLIQVPCSDPYHMVPCPWLWFKVQSRSWVRSLTLAVIRSGLFQIKPWSLWWESHGLFRKCTHIQIQEPSNFRIDWI